MRGLLIFIASLATALLLISGCSKGGGDVIKIGVAGPMTGDQSRYGVDLKTASEWP